MRAAVRSQYGNHKVISIQDISMPDIKSDEVLIEVHYSTVNRTDTGFLQGKPFIARLISGFPNPKSQFLGCEFTGKIVEIGENVTKFKVGDKVFGFDDERFGGHCEYKAISEDKFIRKIPTGVSEKTIVAGTEGAHYALTYLVKTHVRENSTIMVYGSTGAIGSAAVQLAVARGAQVTAVCSSEHFDLMKDLGATKVFEYNNEEYLQDTQKYDVFFDAVGKTDYHRVKKLLNEKGIFTATEFGPMYQNLWLGVWYSLQKHHRVMFPIPVLNHDVIRYLAEMLEAGEFNPLIDKEYKFDDIQEAFKYVESGKKIGNVLIKMPPKK